jgi:hypothetical protein
VPDTETKPEPLTYERAVELLKEIVAGREDYAYKAPIPSLEDLDLDSEELEYYEEHPEALEDVAECLYVNPDGTPSCIVGHLLVGKLGVPAERVKPHEGASARAVASTLGVTPDEEEYGVSVVGLLLNQVQGHQDRGMSWGKALELAIAEANGQ